MDHYQIITKLIGPIKPVGESNEDDQRLMNIINTCTLIDSLIDDVMVAASYSNDQRASVKMIGKYGDEFLDRLRDKIKQ